MEEHKSKSSFLDGSEISQSCHINTLAIANVFAVGK